MYTVFKNILQECEVDPAKSFGYMSVFVDIEFFNFG